jgi:hypothetical protein
MSDTKKPSRVDWDAVREASARGVGTNDLARQFSVSARMIRKQKAADAAAGKPWPAEGSTKDAPAEDHRVIQFRGRNGRKVTVDAPPGDLPNFDGPTPAEHELIDLAMRGIKCMWERYGGGLLKPSAFQSEADLVQRMTISTTAIVHAKREVDGKKPGIPSGEPAVTDQDDALTIESVRIESAKRTIVDLQKTRLTG